MPGMIPVPVTVVMPVPIVIPISIPLVMPSTPMTLDTKTTHYTAGDSLACIFLRPARQRQRTGRQRDSASGGK